MTISTRHQVNFLTQERRDRFARSKKNHKLAKLAILTLVVVSAGLAVLKAWELTRAEQEQLATTHLAQLESNLELFAPLRQTASSINDRLASLDQLEADRLRWTELVTTLAQITPPTIQIVSFTPSLVATRLAFSLSGKAASRPDTIRFKQALEASGKFHDLLIGSSQVAEGGDPTVSFSLTGTLGIASAQPLLTSTPAPSPRTGE